MLRHIPLFPSTSLLGKRSGLLPSLPPFMGESGVGMFLRGSMLFARPFGQREGFLHCKGLLNHYLDLSYCLWQYHSRESLEWVPSGKRGTGRDSKGGLLLQSLSVHLHTPGPDYTTTYDPLKRWVFSKDLKVETKFASLTCVGRPFHKNGSSIGEGPASSCLLRNYRDN
jgi:hypothetical protein